jgi:L-lactate dehydrogenase (cytochrome)
MRAASVSDFRELARRRLPKIFFEYIDGGSYAEETLRRNVADLEAIALRQRVMVDMTELDMSVEVFGQTLSMPVGLAPVGMAGMYAARGEVQAARAAAAAGVPFCLSTVGVCSVEEVTRGAQAPWFQLYMLKDRGFMRELLARAKALGSPVLVFTVDLPVPGARYRDVRSGFTGGTKLQAALTQAWDGVTHPAWTWDLFARGRPHTLGSVAEAVQGSRRVTDFLAWIARNFDRSVTWKDLDWVRETWDGPIVVKGVLDPQDARDAVRAGAQGLVVSNHGGRQLDGVRSSISALPRIADAVGDDLEILMDGGVRSGLDVLKALALGARACLVGRAWAYALGAAARRRWRACCRSCAPSWRWR